MPLSVVTSEKERPCCFAIWLYRFTLGAVTQGITLIDSSPLTPYTRPKSS